MQIDIQSRSFQLTGSVLEYVAQRVRDFLAHTRDHIHNVKVQLIDVNGPRGGRDQRCVVQVKLNRLPVVVTEETQVDVRLAIDRALDRAGRTIKRRLERPRDRRRGTPRTQLQLNLASANLPQLDFGPLRLSPASSTPYLRSTH